MNKQFGLSLRIVLKEKKCHIVRLIVHPLVAILLTFFIINVTKSAGSSQSSKSFADNVINQDELADYFPGELVNKIYFTPQNAFIENLMEAVRQQLYIVDERVVPYPSDAEMEFALLANPHICFGVNFSNITDDGRLEYFIRTKNNNFRTSTVYSQDVYSCYRKQNNEYIESGFLTLQNAVDQAYVAMVQAKPKLSNGERILHIAYGHIPVDDKRGPQEPTRNVELIPVLSVVFVVMDIFALLLPMVEERANGMREYLKMASSASYWKEAALFAINFVIFFTILVVCLIIAFFSGYWDNNPAVIVYHIILAFLFLMNLIAFTFFLSTMLVSPTMATAVAPIVFFGPFFLSILRRGLVAPLCLFPVVGLCYAGMIGEVFKSSGHLFLAHNLFTVDYPGTGYVSMFHVYVCQLLGTAVWLFLWFYVSNVYPGQYGIPQEKWFFLSKSYWQWSPAAGGRNRPRNKNKITTESQRNLQQDLSGSNELGTRMEMHDMPYIDEGIEDIGSIDPEQSKRKDPSVPRSQPLVRIFKLYKAFKGRTGTKEVVRDFSLSIYNHSITVLLGHNGAGKTTTMNIITGILPATSGTIEIDGEANPHRYRQKIGFCPQHNVFFSYLNCLEHLEYFGQLRGLNVSDARAEAKTMLEKVNLLDKRKSLVHTLSGGMKRRLSLAIAIMGHTKLLILDEPTSGLDPESRRDIWDVLLRLRENHTILLTTHFMEEADVLGNWVAIMDDGELVAFGTPLFLKQKYGKGYTLKLFKASNFDAKEAWSLIQRYVPNAVVRDSVQEILAVTLPYDEITQYAAMLKELKDKQRVLGIETFSMANATLEEVFLNSSKQKHEIQHHAESVDSPPSPELFDEPTMSTASTITRRHAMNVVKAIGSKKWIHMKSNKHIFGFLFSLPLLVIICCFIFTTGITDSAKSLPAVWLAAYTIHQPYGILMINRESDSKQPLGNLQTIQSDFDRSPVNGVQMSLVIRENGDSLQDVLREKIVQDYTAYRDQLVVAIECNITNDGTYLTVLYNNNLVHSTGIAESVLTTILLRYYAGTPEAIVRTENIPSTRKQLIDIQTPFYVTELLPIANMFCMLIYLSGPLHEHLTGFRQMHNVNRYLYWGSTYMWDMIVHFVQCVLVVVLLFLLDHKQTFSESSKLSIFWISYVYGLVALPVIYIISQCVQNANTAITIMSYLLITGVAFVFMLSNGYDDIVNNEPWITLLHVVPEFGLKHSMRVVYENQKLTIYEKMSIQQNRAHSALTSFANKRLSLYTFYIMAPAMLVVLVIVLNELVENIYRRDLANEKIRKAYRRLDRGLTISRGGDRARVKRDAEQCDGDQYDETDSPALHVDDVDQQTALVNRLVEDPGEGPSGEYAIIVKALKKTYGDREAVKSVSFAVKKGECFGLLGMNGAGKTTLFEMLSANLPASEGTIYLQRREVRKADEMEYRHQYGYCPQFDALLHFMTVYEVIDYFAQLKGLDMRKTHINSWLTKLDILKYSDHTLEDCSGGTKRKVNTILAMLGGPSVVLLDEPTTGVDPKSRHFLWKTIKAIQRKDQTVLLTSHSMDECEELCNRLSIMVDGRLRCVGTIPELKQRHDKGYNLWIKLKVTLIKPFDETNEDKQLIDEVKERFQATLQEEHKGLLKFLVDVHLELADLFDRILVLESERGHQIENYSINETSLEDIFLLYRPKKRRNT